MITSTNIDQIALRSFVGSLYRTVYLFHLMPVKTRSGPDGVMFALETASL
jgi:hypothetical protein